MSKEDKYYTIPLALLRQTVSARAMLDMAVDYGITSAGLGCSAVHGATRFNALLAEALEEAKANGEPLSCPEDLSTQIWQAAVVGGQLLGIMGGCRATSARTYLEHHRPGEVFFRIRSDWMWNAVLTARREAGQEVRDDLKPLSWREFRLLAAILSTQTNKQQFTFLGWESIQARACGYHTKQLFQAGKEALPFHCQPLSRDMIRATLERMEALGFFARCRYSCGQRGGFMAYSFRHTKREALAAAVKEWRANRNSLKTKTAGHRAADLAAFQKKKPASAAPAPAPPPSHDDHPNLVF